MSETKVWFITGCSSGFGLSITEHALAKGDKVVATLRKPDVLSNLAAKYPETLLVLKLDVTQPTEVTAALTAGLAKFGRIDVVVNNAGFAVAAEVEGITDDVARRVLEVNFWGASYVSKEAVRCFREVNRPMGGRLLQMSSASGICPPAGGAYYSVSKFALETFSECLAKELDPMWNIQVTIIEPGPFRTKSVMDNLVIEPVHPAYAANPSLPSMQLRALIADRVATNALFNGDPVKLAEAVYRMAYLKDPPLRLPLHTTTLNNMKERGNYFLDTADRWRSWSEGMEVDDGA